MLQYKAVSPALLRVLKELMQIEYFKDLCLVGGTSLALQIGHRNSVDIDLFGNIDFEYLNVIDSLKKIGKVEIISQSKNINIITIDDIKVDFVNYRYKWINKIKNIDGLRLASIEDIVAMKLNAIANRGNKKDFIDVFFLLKKYSFNKMLEFYSQKFDDGNIFLVKKSMVYFEDAEKTEMPKMVSNITWQEVKKGILQTV